MIRIDALTGTAPKPVATGAPECPGANVLLTKQDYVDITKGGEIFATSRQNIPADGYGLMRVLCRREVERVPESICADVIYYGLCSSCSELEAGNRRTLRTRMSLKQERRSA